MNSNLFREDELIKRQVQVGNEWQTKIYPVLGGRLRVAHEQNQHLSIRTDVIRVEADVAMVKATVEMEKGSFNGTGTASAQRDAKLAGSLVEVAETRAVTRALRFAGIGVETGAEEISTFPEPAPMQNPYGVPKPAQPVPVLANPYTTNRGTAKYPR